MDTGGMCSHRQLCKKVRKVWVHFSSHIEQGLAHLDVGWSTTSMWAERVRILEARTRCSRIFNLPCELVERKCTTKWDENETRRQMVFYSKLYIVGTLLSKTQYYFSSKRPFNDMRKTPSCNKESTLEKEKHPQNIKVSHRKWEWL